MFGAKGISNHLTHGGVRYKDYPVNGSGNTDDCLGGVLSNLQLIRIQSVVLLFKIQSGYDSLNFPIRK